MVTDQGNDEEERDLDSMIEDQHWDEVYERFRNFPENTKAIVNPSLGWTKLHWLCSIGASPPALIDLVASLYPEAVTMPDNRYGDTPLHIVCRNSQISAEKIVVLLQHIISNEELLIRNRFGGTALHSAANHNAVLAVLQALVGANRRILTMTTHDGIHSVTALWSSYNSTIPGVTCVAQILNGEIEAQRREGFLRFWRKVEYLSSEFFTCKNEDNITSNEDPNRFVLHGLIHCNVPINLFKVALKVNPALANTVDSDGNTSLHILLENRPYRLKEREAIMALLDASPQAAFIANNSGEVPLLIAIRNKIPWINGTGDVVEAATPLISRRDNATGLYPFQLAALHGGKVAVETTFLLLSIKPDLLQTQNKDGMGMDNRPRGARLDDLL